MSTKSKKTVGVVGGSGYTGGELLRLLLNHPHVLLDFVYSTTRGGKPITSAHPDLLGQTELAFTNEINPHVDILFLCLGHGLSGTFLHENPVNDNTKVIDLSNDFRLHEDRHFMGKSFVYGLPEFQKAAIQSAQAIANPGCFATAIQLALLPLADAGLLTNDVHIHALTGSTGAGIKPSDTGHFSWRNNNVSWYKPFTHQHLGEIGETLTEAQGKLPELHFLPIRGNFTRGIFVTAYTSFSGTEAEAKQLYQKFYAGHPFTHVSESPVHLKQVVNTNNCVVHLHKHGNQLLITSVIDNLLKGASGQAVENMNLICGWDQQTGLHLKPSVF
ncbi:MAG: N-acetyl-gamma-glutamyl-phosphate reductase [Flavobacteriaceae bacterium]